jgi:hypothetical protein
MRTLILYADDFCKNNIWEQVCGAVGADASFDKLTLTVSDFEESTILEDEERGEEI